MSDFKILTKDQQIIEVDVDFLKIAKALFKALQDNRTPKLCKKSGCEKEISEVIGDNAAVGNGSRTTTELDETEAQKIKIINQDGSVLLELPTVSYEHLKHIINWCQAVGKEPDQDSNLSYFSALNVEVLLQIIEIAQLLDINELPEDLSLLLTRSLAKQTDDAFENVIKNSAINAIDDEGLEFTKLIQFYDEVYLNKVL